MRIGNIEFQRIENIDEIFDSDIIAAAKNHTSNIISEIKNDSLDESEIYEKIYSLVQNLDLIEASKKKQKIAVECLCITENVLGRMSDKYPQLVEREIKNAISAARENNKDKILTLNKKVKDYGAKNSKLIEDVENFEESNKKIKPKKVEIRNFYHKKISKLNNKLIQKAEIKIEINNMNSAICENKRQLIGIEEDILYLEEDISAEKSRHNAKVADLTDKINELDKEIMEAQSSYRLVKEESDFLLSEYFQLKEESVATEAQLENMTAAVQKIRDDTVVAVSNAMSNKEEIDCIEAILPILEEKKRREVEIHSEAVKKHGKQIIQLGENIQIYDERRKAGMAVLLGAERDHDKVVEKLTKAAKSTSKVKEKLDKFKIMYLGKMEERSQVKRQIKEFELSLQHIIKTSNARENKSKSEIRQLQHVLNKEMKEMRTLEHVRSMEDVKSQEQRGKVNDYQQQTKADIKQFKAKVFEDKDELVGICARICDLEKMFVLLGERLPHDREELAQLAERIYTEREVVEGEVGGIERHLWEDDVEIRNGEGRIKDLVAELGDKQRKERKLKNMILSQKREKRAIESVIPEITEGIEANNREREHFSGETESGGLKLLANIERQNGDVLGMNKKMEMNKVILNIVGNERDKLKGAISNLREELGEFNAKMGRDEEQFMEVKGKRVVELDCSRDVETYGDMLQDIFQRGIRLEAAIGGRTCRVEEFVESLRGNVGNCPHFGGVRH